METMQISSATLLVHHLQSRAHHDHEVQLQPAATLTTATAADGGDAGVVVDGSLSRNIRRSTKKKRIITYKDVTDPAEYDEYLSSFPGGFRFDPTDKELIVSYLMGRVENKQLPANRINEVNIYDHNPEFLASERFKSYENKEWYFFTPRDRKYPNGDRPNRAAGDGYWKATGVDKIIRDDRNGGIKLGSKKTLVFYRGRPPKGDKTSWIMHEYKVDKSQIMKKGNKTDMKLDCCVLCRIHCKESKSDKSYNKKPAAAMAVQPKRPKNKSKSPNTDDKPILEKNSPPKAARAPVSSNETPDLGELDEEEQVKDEHTKEKENVALFDDLIYGYTAAAAAAGGMTDDYNSLYTIMDACAGTTSSAVNNLVNIDNAPLCPFIDACAAVVGTDAVAGDIIVDVDKDSLCTFINDCVGANTVACKLTNVDKVGDKSLSSLKNPCTDGVVDAVVGNVANEVENISPSHEKFMNTTSVGVGAGSVTCNVDAGSYVTGNVAGEVDNSGTPVRRFLNACAGGEITDGSPPVTNGSAAASSTLHQWTSAAAGYNKYNLSPFAGFYHDHQMQQAGYDKNHVSLFHEVHPPIRRDYLNTVHSLTSDQMQYGRYYDNNINSVAAPNHDGKNDHSQLVYDGHQVFTENKINLAALHQDDPLLHDGNKSVFTDNELDSFILDNINIEEDIFRLKSENFMFGGADVWFDNGPASQKKESDINRGKSDNGPASQKKESDINRGKSNDP